MRRALPCARGLATVIPNLSGSNNLSRWSHGSSKRRLFVVPQRSRRTPEICTRSWPLSNYKSPPGGGLGAPGASATEYHPPAYFDKVTFESNVFNMLPDFQWSHLHRSKEQIQTRNIDTRITLQISSNIKTYHVYISSYQVIECDSVKLVVAPYLGYTRPVSQFILPPSSTCRQQSAAKRHGGDL